MSDALYQDQVHNRLGADVGYVGEKTDPEPNEVYTVAGQVGASANPDGEPEPETEEPGDGEPSDDE